MFKHINFFPFLTDFILKMSIGVIFFNYGYVKLIKLINNEGEALIIMISNIVFFGSLPIFFSWALALTEVLIIFAFIYSFFHFLPLANLISKVAGILCFIISVVIVYQHIFVWGDNVFSYGPFDFLNTQEAKKSIFGQILFIPISLCIIFNNRAKPIFLNDNK